jgi:hypothetical protein
MNNTQIMVRIQQSKSHFSHPSNYFGDLSIIGIPFLDEFIASWLLTMIFAFIFYFGLSSLSYLIFYKIGH